MIGFIYQILAGAELFTLVILNRTSKTCTDLQGRLLPNGPGTRQVLFVTTGAKSQNRSQFAGHMS
jgi:hypothetical protein